MQAARPCNRGINSEHCVWTSEPARGLYWNGWWATTLYTPSFGSAVRCLLGATVRASQAIVRARHYGPDYGMAMHAIGNTTAHPAGRRGACVSAGHGELMLAQTTSPSAACLTERSTAAHVHCLEIHCRRLVAVAALILCAIECLLMPTGKTHSARAPQPAPSHRLWPNSG